MPTYQILYARRPTFHPSGAFGTASLTLTGMQASHVRLCEVEADNLDDAWRQMQAEHWSPNGEARPLMERLGLSHTSMSVGDVIRDKDGAYWESLDPSTTLRTGLGWSPVEDDTQREDDHGQV